MNKKKYIMALSVFATSLSLHQAFAMNLTPIGPDDIQAQIATLQAKGAEIQETLNKGASAFVQTTNAKAKELIETVEDSYVKINSLKKKINESKDGLFAKRTGLTILANQAIIGSNLAVTLGEFLEIVQVLAKGELHTNKTAGDDLQKKIETAIESLAKIDKANRTLKNNAQALSNSGLLAEETRAGSRAFTAEDLQKAKSGLKPIPTAPPAPSLTKNTITSKPSTLGQTSTLGGSSTLGTIGSSLATGWQAIGGTQLVTSASQQVIAGGFDILKTYISAKLNVPTPGQISEAERKRLEDERAALVKLQSQLAAYDKYIKDLTAFLNPHVAKLNDGLSSALRKLKVPAQDIIDSINSINAKITTDNEENNINNAINSINAMTENNTFLMDIALVTINAVKTFAEDLKETDAQLLVAAAANAKLAFNELKASLEDMPTLQAKINSIYKQYVEEQKALAAAQEALAKKFAEEKALEEKLKQTKIPTSPISQPQQKTGQQTQSYIPGL